MAARREPKLHFYGHMADKVQNVVINFKTNTVEVQKATDLLNRANAASNAFQSSAQKGAQTTSTAFKQTAASIETLEAKVISLRQQIRVSSDPAAIKRLSDEYKRLKTQLDAANKSAYELPKALKETGGATQSLSGQLGQLYSAFKLVFAAGAVKEIVSFALEMARLQGNVEGVERAFNRAFPNEIQLLNRLRSATHGTVSDFELMQRTLQATNLGVAVEQLPILFEFAAARAQQTGESVDYLVDSIVRGIGRKSILVLDNLGLSATRLREQFNGASLASQSVADVTRGVAEIARVELEKMGGYAETAATKVGQLEVSIKELRIETAKKIESGGFIQFLNDAVSGLKVMIQGRREYLQEQARNIAAQDAERVLAGQAFKDLGNDQIKKLDFIQQEINSRVQLIGRYNDTIAALKEERQVLSNKNPYDDHLEVLDRQVRGYENNKFIILETIEILKDYLKEFSKVTEAEKEQLGIIETLQNRIELVGDAIKKAMTVESIENLNGELVRLEFQLRELQNLGKDKPIVDASKIFDIRQGQRGGGAEATRQNVASLDLGVNSESLEQDAADLAKNVGDRYNKELTDKLMEGAKGSVGLSLREAFLLAQDELIAGGIDILANSLVTMQDIELESLQTRLANIRDFYDEQQILAGDNERAKKELALREERETSKLRREAAEKEKRARIFSIVIDTAASIAKTAAQLGYPAAIPFIALAAANGLAQLAVVSRSQPRGFAKGVLNLDGPGSATSDSIPARLSRGESIMTAAEWRSSKNVLQEVRAKKLDDNVLRELKQGREPVRYQAAFDDRNLIKKLDEIKNNQPDIEKRGDLLYVTKKKSDNYKLWVRKSSMSS